MSSKSTFGGHTVVATTITLDTSQEKIGNLFIGQVALNGYNNFNLILDTKDGLYYSSTETFDGLMPYLEKYNKNGWINTDGVRFDKYVKRVYKKYLVDYPDRPAYLIYVCAKGIGFKGENKIMAINDIDAIKKAGKEFLVSLLSDKDVDDETKMKVMRRLILSGSINIY
jgi:hypothetical protein